MIGKSVSHYKILKKLGSGGMGDVYLAEDSKLKRTVALKFLPPELTRDPNSKKRFIYEAQAAAALYHPNICTIYEIDEVDELAFIAMAYMPGQSLKDMIDVGPMKLEVALTIAIQVADGLFEAHQKNIVHRDVKPANIMVTPPPREQVKIMDFGLAKLSDRTKLTKASTTLGTVAYMSPEQTQGGNVDQRTDLWSFGIVLYEMVTGQTPFKGDYEQAVLYSILNEDPEPMTGVRTGVPMELERIVTKALAKSLEERYQNANDILIDLKSVKKEIESGLSKVIPPQKKSIAQVRPVRLEKALAGLAEQRDEMKSGAVISSVPKHTVGRKQELSKLHAGFQSALNGRGQLLCVTGEAGMGKTTLMEDFFNELSANGHPCLIARGQSSERLAGTEGYLPILEGLESMLRGAAGESVANVMKVVAPTWYVEVVPLSSEDSSAAHVIADAKAASPERKKRELDAFLHEVSRIRPLILFFDDLHWADVSTIDVLAFIGNKCESMALLIVVAYRPAELLLSENKFPQVKLNLQARRICHDISLGFLSLEDMKNYLALEFPRHDFPEEFAQLIHKQTEGSPLFMVDLLRNLRDNGVIFKVRNRWELKQSVADIKSELPQSIRSMIQRKIDQLSETDHRLLVAASVQGKEFDSAVLAKVLEMDAEEVEERLEGLSDVHSFVRLLNEHEFPDMTPTLVYTFVHNLYQNSFYNSLSLTRKASLSISVAETLLTYYGEQSSEVASELAFLFEAGRDFERASDYFLQAARNAASVYANEEAVELSQRAIKNAKRLQSKKRYKRIVAAALGLAQIHMSISRFEDAISDFTLVQKLDSEAGDIKIEISALCGMAYAIFNIRDIKKHPEMLDFINRALEIAETSDSIVSKASAELVLAFERLASGALTEAETLFDRAIPILKKNELPIQALQAVSYRGFLHAWRLEYIEAQRVSEWALQQARELGGCFYILANLLSRSLALGNQGRISEALDTLHEGWQFAELNGERYFIARFPNTVGWLYSEMQDLQTAMQFDQQNIPLAQEVGFQEGEANTHVNLAHNYLLLNEPKRALEHLQAAERIFNYDIWFRWRYNIRLQAEFANYWIKMR